VNWKASFKNGRLLLAEGNQAVEGVIDLVQVTGAL
jgi:hypothetical protein